MNHLDLELEYFIRSLINWIQYPGANSMFDFQRKAISLRRGVSEYSKQMEERITKNVLNAIAIKIEKDGALNEIKALKNAIDSLGK